MGKLVCIKEKIGQIFKIWPILKRLGGAGDTLLFGALGTSYANTFASESSTLLTQSFENAFLNLGNWGQEDPARPQGMLNYMFLDENFELVSGTNASGYDQIDYSAGFDPAFGPGAADVLNLPIGNIH